MPLGYGLLIFALAATVAANVLFTLSHRAERPAAEGSRLRQGGQRAVLLAAAGIVGASAYLGYLIATHQFQVTYVAEYSAKRSAAKYLFAAFWGGQEGSILLWAFWTAILGAVLALRGGSRTSRVWPLFGIAQLYLLGLLLMKCPFALGKGPAPEDGRGLNPLLENPWMVIHPPLLFLGFASTLIPAAWAVYGLLYRDWDGWAKAAFSWALFSFATLGFGLSLGGYWAYETLGWGGFWAWDPVENSSLVPWLFLTALLHGIPLQLRSGGCRITNFLLGFLPFAAMNYGTFLTRTGILSDFSVHSFSSLGKDGYYIMLGGVLLTTFAPLVLLLVRARRIPRPPAYEKVLTREFGFFLSSALLGVVGLIVAAGMSAPLITKLWLPKGAAAQPEFYNQATYPLAILMTLLMAATPYLAWKANDFSAVTRRLFPSYIAAIGITLAMTLSAIWLGVRKPWMVLLFATSIFALLSNLVLILPRLKHASSRRSIGGFVAHLGAGMTLAGIAALVAFSQNVDNLPLVKNVPQKALGYTVTYLGSLTQPFDREGNAIRIRVEKDGRAWESRPRYYFAPWEGKDTLFANPPAIHRRFWGDLYIAHAADPSERMDDPGAVSSNNLFSLQERQTRAFGDYTFTLLGLSLDEKAREALAKHDPKALEALPSVTMKAFVAVTYQGKESVVSPSIRQEKDRGIFSEIAPIPGPEGSQTILRFVPPTPEEMQASDPYQILKFETFNAPDPQETIYISLSRKPLIWFVWAGTLLFTLGGLVAYRRRASEGE